MTYSIRRAVTEDIPQIYRISASARKAGYSALIPESRRQDFAERCVISSRKEQEYTHIMKDRMQESSWYIWVAEYEGRVKGYAVAYKMNDRLLRAKELFVDPQYQGEGIGSALLKTVLEVIKKGTIELSVLTNNEPAKYLYAKNGFIVTGADPRDYFGAKRQTMQLNKN